MPRPRPTRPVPAGDPYNCAVDAVEQWGPGKKAWCCKVHHKGCPFAPPPPVMIPQPMPVMPIGKWGGQWERRRGVAKFMGKDALARLAVRPLPSRTTVLQDMLTGWQVGVSAKRRGAARTRARAAPQPPEDVLDNFQLDIQLT